MPYPGTAGALTSAAHLMTDTHDRIDALIAPGGHRPEGRPPWWGGQRAASSAFRWIVIAVILALSVVMFMHRYRVPYFYVAPGPPTDVLTVIAVKGAKTYPSAGKLLLTTASVGQQEMNLWDVVSVWLDPDAEAVPVEALRPPGQTDDEADAEGRSQMRSSKIGAELAAFRALGLKVPVVAGAYVLATTAGSASDGVLQEGDVLVRVDGDRVKDQRSIAPALEDRKLGDVVPIEFRRDDKLRSTKVRLKTTLKGSSRPALGIHAGLAYRFPSNVEIDTGRVIGPSGGLVFALSLADVLTPDDLTRGYVVAVTGTIGPTTGCGESVEDVCPIGAIEEKVRSAELAGAEVFIVPSVNEAGARAVAPGSMTVIGVRTLTEAIDALRKLPLKT